MFLPGLAAINRKAPAPDWSTNYRQPDVMGSIYYSRPDISSSVL